MRANASLYAQRMARPYFETVIHPRRKSAALARRAVTADADVFPASTAVSMAAGPGNTRRSPLDIAPRKRGDLVAFRAHALHRVTPVTRGAQILVDLGDGPNSLTERNLPVTADPACRWLRMTAVIGWGNDGACHFQGHSACPDDRYECLAEWQSGDS